MRCCWTGSTFLLQAKRGQKFTKEPRLSLHLLEEMCNDIGAGSSRSVIHLYQLHGQMVHVPPGYIHCVQNLAPCIKLAWDFYNPASFPGYLEALTMAGGKYFGADNARDYMGPECLISEVAAQRVTNSERFHYLRRHVEATERLANKKKRNPKRKA